MTFFYHIKSAGNLNFILFLLGLLFRPGGIPARNHKGERLLLYLGIIDILQSYRMRKKIEHVFKAMLHDGVSVTFNIFWVCLGFCFTQFIGFLKKRIR